MDLRRFRYVLGIAEHGQFTKAAEALHVSQPALSQMIRNLEEELSVQIFERSPNGVVVTEAGKLVIEHARQALNITKSLTEEIAAYNGLKWGNISVGILQTFGALYLPGILAPFLQDYPEIDVNISELSNDQIHEQVKSGELNLGIGFPERTHQLDTFELYSDDLVYACCPTHRFSVHQSLSSAELASERLALLPTTFSTRREIDALFSDLGVHPKNIVTFNTFSAILSAVNSGACASIIPANAKRVSPSLNLHFGKLNPSPSKHKICLLRDRARFQTPASDAFTSAVIGYFSK